MSASAPNLAAVKKEKKEKKELTAEEQAIQQQIRAAAHAVSEKEKNLVIDLTFAQAVLDAAAVGATSVDELIQRLAPHNHIAASIAKHDSFPVENISFATLAAFVLSFSTKTKNCAALALKIVHEKLNLSAFTQHAARSDLSAAQRKIVENTDNQTAIKLAMDPAARRGFTPLGQLMRAALTLASDERRSDFNMPPKAPAVGADGEPIVKPVSAKRGARTASERDDATPSAPKKPTAPRKPAAAATKGAAPRKTAPATAVTPDPPKWGSTEDASE